MVNLLPILTPEKLLSNSYQRISVTYRRSEQQRINEVILRALIYREKCASRNVFSTGSSSLLLIPSFCVETNGKISFPIWLVSFFLCPNSRVLNNNLIWKIQKDFIVTIRSGFFQLTWNRWEMKERGKISWQLLNCGKPSLK